MYYVKGRYLKDFNEVVQFAWNQYKIELYEEPLSEEEEQQAVQEFISMLEEEEL